MGSAARGSGQDLALEPYLAREAGSGTREVAAAALAAKGVELSPALEVQARRASSAPCSAEVSPSSPSAWSSPRSRLECSVRFPCRASSFAAPCAPYVAADPRCRDRRALWSWLERTIAPSAQ